MTITAVLAGAAVLSVCSVVVGQALWRLGGFEGWSWLAGPTGLAVLAAIAGPATDLPGAGTAGAVSVLAATVAAGVALAIVRRRRLGGSGGTRAELLETVGIGAAALVVAALPFIATGHTGILAVTDNADFYAHVMLADGVRAGVEPVGLDPAWAADYPTGPHALVASLAESLGIDVDAAFTALLLTILVLSVLAAVSVLRETSLPRRVLGGLVAGIPYLAASYTVQTSFKETLLGLIVVGWLLAVPVVMPVVRARPLALVPLLALAAGAYADYGIVGLGWLAIVTVAFLAARLVMVGGASGLDRSTRVAVAVGVCGLVAALAAVAQLDQAKALIGNVEDVAEGTTVGGNIRAELPVYQVFGVWPKADLRETTGALLVPRGLALLAVGAALWAAWWWWRRRGRAELPAAAMATLVIYAGARATATPYYSGKALAIAAFVVGLMTMGALVLALPPWRGLARARFAAKAGALLATVVLVAAAWSSTTALRGARVAPTGHTNELESLRGVLAGKPTLYLGKHNYIPWILRGVPVAFPAIDIGRSQVEFARRPAKPWNVEQLFDFDNVLPEHLDRFEFALGPRGAYRSQPPPNWRLVRATASYALWKREGATQPREVLPEAGAPAALFDCTAQPELAGRDGEGAVVPAPVVFEPAKLRDANGRPLRREEFGFARIETGDVAEVKTHLPAGRWSVSLQYVSPTSVDVQVGRTRLAAPASLEGPGGFWHVGTFSAGGERTTVSIRPKASPPLAAFRTVLLGSLTFTKADEATRIVPLRAACNRYVDWYRQSAP